MRQSFTQRLNALKETHAYKVEVAKLEFVRGLTREMKLKRMSNTELASKIDTSNAYITKALRGESNFTIDSMVKLASAVGANLHIHIADNEASVRWLEAHPQPSRSQGIKEGRYADRKVRDPEAYSQGIREIFNEACKIYA